MRVLFFACLVVAPALAQSDCAKIASRESSTYGFRPSKLTEAQRRQKSALMDSYWDLVKHAGPAGVTCLRSLVDKQTDPFATFDEAALLYSLDPSRESGEIAARAISRADLVEVQPADYLRFALRLAKQGIDIAPAAHNYLNAKNDVTAYLPEHGAYKVDRVTGALLLYAVMPTDQIDDELSKEVTSSNAEARNAAVIVWSLNMSERSFKGIAALGEMAGFSVAAKEQVRRTLTPVAIKVKPPKYTREQMLAKLAKFPEMDFDPNIDPGHESDALDNSVYATFGDADVTVLRESRRKLITGLSNESVEGYAEMSRVLLNLINKLNLYEEFRRAK